MFVLTGCPYLAGQSTFYLNKIPGGGLPPYKRLIGMCIFTAGLTIMVSHFQ